MPRKIEARQSDIHGNGVFAIAPIEKGERVVEYKGKRRTHEEVDADDTGDVRLEPRPLRVIVDRIDAGRL